MVTMQTDSQTYWTDDRIQATVTPEYIVKQFKAEQRDQLKQSISFGEGVTDHTYLGWILNRSTRFFLILAHLGSPEQIFGLIDESYDDNDLPIAAEAVKSLGFSSGSKTSLERNFYKAQFGYLIREVKQGHHIRFLDEETIPVKPVGSASGINRSGKDGIEKVHLTSGGAKVYGRKRVALEEAPSYLTEADVLSEITAAKRLVNQHVLSVYGSYVHGNNVFILLTPAIEYTLNSFVDSPPKHFENLPKGQRRETLLNWPHCLANGLAWLHSNHRAHGAIRPSNVLIDSAYRIYLGQVDGLTITHGNAKSSDIESYQYAAPERWKRAATMQRKAPPMLSLHSGGRTARKPSSRKNSAPGSVDDDAHDVRGAAAPPTSPSLPIDVSKPTSTAYQYIPTSKANIPRGQGRIERAEYASSILSSDSSGTRQDRLNSLRVPTNQPDYQLRRRTASSASAHSHEGGQNLTAAVLNSVTVAPSEIKTAVVQTWQSAQFDPFAADVFSLGAIILDIVTFLCKRSSSAFSRHRSTKNRTAGRGGGVADASFHANLGQVFSWTVSLEQDAKKKASKDDGKIFQAISPMIEVARECLARAAEDRPEVGMVERSLESCIQQSTSSGTAHCSFRTHSRGGQLDSSEQSRSGLRALAMHPTTATATAEKPARRMQPSARSRWKSGSSVNESVDYTNSLTSFNFDEYAQDPERYGQGDDDASEGPSRQGRYSATYPDDSTIDLQSIADRPDRIMNGTDISGWSHMHTESRASYVSSDTQSHSVAEPQRLDTFFQPASGPPTVPPKQLYQVRAGRVPSHASMSPSTFTNAAPQRNIADVARQRQKGSTADSAQQPGHVSNLEIARGRKSGSSTDSSRPYGNAVGSITNKQGRSGSSTDSEDQRDSVTSRSSHSRGRLSVSTLASNTSTIRLSWQERDVSPMSVRDLNRTPNASVSALTSPVSDDDEGEGEATDRDIRSRPYSPDAEKQNQAASAGEVDRHSRAGRKPPARPAGDGKGKQKAEGTGSRRAWLQSRYSMLGGKT